MTRRTAVDSGIRPRGPGGQGLWDSVTALHVVGPLTGEGSLSTVDLVR